MFQKTEQSEVSTNAEHRTTSFYTSSAREMFINKKLQSAPHTPQVTVQQPNDLLTFSPSAINSLAWPSIFNFDNEINVGVKNNYYEISGLRGRNKYVNRHSECQAEIVYFQADKPTKKIHLITIERYLLEEDKINLHINVSKYDPQNGNTEENDYHIACWEDNGKGGIDVWDFKSFETVDSLRKAIIVVQVKAETQSSSHFKFVLIDLMDRKKVRSSGKRMASVLNVLDLDCEMSFGRQGETFLRTIKSEFGDIVLAITNFQIYEIELEDINDSFKLTFKPYKISKTLGNSQQNNHQVEQICDVRFMSNGLKIILLTNYGRIAIVEAHNFISGQSVKQLMEGMSEKYNIDSFEFTKLYPVNGVIAVQFNSRDNCNLFKNPKCQGQISSLDQLKKGLIILKAQNNIFSLTKLINLFLDPKELNHFELRECEGADQLLLQYIYKKKPEVLEIYKCRILMLELNTLARINQHTYNYTKVVKVPQQKLTHYQPNEEQKLYHTASSTLTSRVFYLLRDNQLTVSKVFKQNSTTRQMTQLFSHTFFEKPVKITVNPLNLHFAIVFRQFVKFFYFCHSDFKNYFTLKIKNISEVRYIGRGQKMLICGTDGVIHLIDSYTFREQILMDFYGEVTEAHLIDQRFLFIKSNKNCLYLFKNEKQQDTDEAQYIKKYEVKIEDGDLYHLDSKKIVVFRKKARIEVYLHTPEEIPNQITQAEKQCYGALKDIHPHLSRKVSCISFAKQQIPTYLLLSEELGFIFVATNKGNIKQYLYPLQAPTNPNPPDVCTQQVSSHKLLSLSLDARYTHLYAVSQDSAIIQLQITQYINAELMPFTYIINEKTFGAEMQKRQFTDRNYFIDNFTPTQSNLTVASQQAIEELQFFVDKLRDDLEQMTKNSIAKNKVQEKGLKNNTKQMEKEFNIGLKKEAQQYQLSLQEVKKLLEMEQVQHKMKKQEQTSQYQKTLLTLYRQNDRLKNILKTQDQKMSQEKSVFVADFQRRLNELQKEKTIQVNQLQHKYNTIEEQRRKAELQHKIFNEEEEAQMELYKVKIRQQEEDQLARAEDRKEQMLGENAKREKEINNLKHRSNYFQNLILQTKVQINQLTKDQSQYENKKIYLQEQLKDKESIIERIERQLVQYLKNTEDMKTIKNNHQFELQEYEKQVNPITDNHKLLENNVKQMNQEIMNEYTNKVQKIDMINNLNQKAQQLKQYKKQSLFKKLHRDNQFVRLTERLVYLATHPFDGDVKAELRELIDDEGTDNATKLNEEKEKYKREGEKLIRYKNMIRRQIEEEQKREEHIVKNEHEFFKYHNQNTTLIRQFNELKKTQKMLIGQETKLKDKLNAIKSSLMQTPLRRVPSLHIHRPTQKKLTPFQRYEEEQSIMTRKQQDTSDTKLSRNSQSLSFLKGLMKEMNHVDSKNQKMQVMRERVRTFVNPQLKNKNRSQEIKKILFGRSRGISEGLKLQ